MKNKTIKSYLIVFILIIILNFFLPRILPGGPVAFIQGGDDQSFIMTEEQKAHLLSYYGLDLPLHEQFYQYIFGILTGDFGLSILYKTAVTTLILSHMKWTLFLVGIASIISILLGIILGILSAWNKRKKNDAPFFLAMLMLGAIPEFILGMVLLILFSTKLGWFPFSGSTTPFAQYGEGIIGIIAGMKDILHHSFLPMMTLTVVNISSIYLLMRNATFDVLKEPYIYTAEVKGLPLKRLLFRHTFKNAFLPVFTLIMLRFGFMLTGAIFVETVFSYPGIGKLLQEAILSRDYPLMQGLFLIFTITILGMNLIADMVYPKLDPRIRRGERTVFE